MDEDMLIAFKLVFKEYDLFNNLKNKIVYFDSVDEAYKFYQIFKDEIVRKNIVNKNLLNHRSE